MVFSILICVLIGILAVIYIYIQRQLNFWKRNNIPFIKPLFPYGSIKGAMVKKHLTFLTQDFYNEMKGKGPFGGMYFLLSPVILTLDIEFVKKILIKDFNHFEDRGVYYNDKDDPLSAHLFALKEKPWRKLRSKLTPTFTSGKMKFMYPTIIDVGQRFTDTLSDILKTSNDAVSVEIKELLVRFTTDVIGTCAFGIECNSLNDPNSRFHEMGQRHFKTLRHHPLIGTLVQIFDDFARFIGVKQLHDDVAEFFMKIVLDTIKYREENNVHRNDFMDILLKLKNEGDSDNALSVNEIAAQVIAHYKQNMLRESLKLH